MIPRFDVDAYVNFLIDTGSDVSTLHSRDAVKLGIPFERLESRRTIGGVGGRAEYLVEDEAVLLFHDGPLYRIYVVALAVGKLGPQEANLPSLLGRPLLNNWRTYIDPVDGRVEIVAENAVVNKAPTPSTCRHLAKPRTGVP